MQARLYGPIQNDHKWPRTESSWRESSRMTRHTIEDDSWRNPMKWINSISKFRNKQHTVTVLKYLEITECATQNGRFRRTRTKMKRNWNCIPQSLVFVVFDVVRRRHMSTPFSTCGFVWKKPSYRARNVSIIFSTFLRLWEMCLHFIVTGFGKCMGIVRRSVCRVFDSRTEYV